MALIAVIAVMASKEQHTRRQQLVITIYRTIRTIFAAIEARATWPNTARRTRARPRGGWGPRHDPTPDPAPDPAARPAEEAEGGAGQEAAAKAGEKAK